MQFLELKGKAWLIPITAEKPAEAISEAIKVHLNPIPDIDISFEKIDEATIIVVKIFAGQQTPYYYEGDGQLIAYVRIGMKSGTVFIAGN